jgi:hypothetical protein
MIGIDIGNSTFCMPENWTEIVQNNLFGKVAAINAESPSREAAQLQLLQDLCGMNGFAIGKALRAGSAAERTELAARLNDQIAAQIMDEVYPMLDFIFNEPYTHNPLPELWHRGLRYHGPDEKLQTQSGWEMEECAWAYAEYSKTGDIKFLNRLVAVLYRPRPWLWFGKSAYKAGAVEANEKRVAAWPLSTKLSILFFYQMCETWWAQEYSFLYDPQPEGSKAPTIDSLAVSKLIRNMAGGKRGTINDIRNMQRNEIYFELAEQWRENNDRK